MLILAQPLALATAQTPQADEQASPLVVGDQAAERIVDLGLNPTDQNLQVLAFLSQLEHAGQLSPGTVATLDAAASSQTASTAAVIGSLPPPRQIFKETYRVCDLNGDKVDDIIVNQYDFTLQQPRVSAYDGDTGKVIWNYLGLLFYFPISDTFLRDGLPTPWHPDNIIPTFDGNGNGVCDLLFMGFTFRLRQSLAPAAAILEFIVHVQLHEGSNGAVIWNRQIPGQVIQASDPLGAAQVQVVEGFPTGFIAFDTPTGPKFVLKRTDVYFMIVQDPLGVFFVSSMWVSEHIHYADVKTGRDVWVRDMPFNTDSDITNLTWVTGVGDVTGDAEPDILLDQMFYYNPRSITPGFVEDQLLGGQPLFRYGRGVSALALRGGPQGGDTIWSQILRDEGYGRVNTQGEELFNTIIWTSAQVLPDITGDNASDFVSLILTQEFLDATTVNGQFRTILTPLSGADGTLLWPGSEIRQQGWGYTAALKRNDSAPNLIAFGTIDLPTANVPEGRFPLKDVRITVLDARDGSARWSYAAQFPQDSYLSYHLALEQYLHALAPIDYDDDGLAEVVTPSEFIAAIGNNQTLLATAKHRYTILRGSDGEPLAAIEAWGSNGMMTSCGDRLLVLSGHGKQIDTSRVNITQYLPDWRETLWIDPTFTSATAGTDVVYLTGKCTVGTDNRTHVSVNFGLNSQKRGFEIVPVFGMVYDDKGEAAWLNPRPLVSPEYDFLNKTLIKKQASEPTKPEQVGWALAPLVPGALAGFAVAFFTRRRGGGVA